MAGGQGTRFWPESTRKRPKQYLDLVGDHPLLTETLMRFGTLVPPQRRYITTVKEQKTLAREKACGHIPEENFIFEPTGRNTAPCILLALAHLMGHAHGVSREDVVAIVPSDHIILNAQGFRKTLQEAKDLAHGQKKIVTIGIPPTFPHTGLGYIHRGRRVEGGGAKEGFEVLSFTEKPDFQTAKAYLERGEHFWNAGILVATLGTFLSEFEEHDDATFRFFSQLKQYVNENENENEEEGEKEKEKKEETLAQLYKQIPANSIDYALMEKSKAILVLPARFDWNDLGSWDALAGAVEPTDGNTVAKAHGHFFHEAKGNIVYTPGKFASLIGVDDLIVVANERAVLVLPKSKSQDVKKIVAHLNLHLKDHGQTLL